MIWLTYTIVMVVLLNTIYSFGQTNNDCSKNEEIAALEIQLDHNADETGYTLVCDDLTIWDVPIGSLADQPSGAWKIERTCIRNDVSICNFTISDDGQDGITGGENGFLSLSFGATTVAYLEYGKVTPFNVDSYCFGTGCDSQMIENKEDDDEKKGWKIVYFNDTTVQESNSTESEENEPNFEGSGVWVVNVTNKKNDEPDDDRNDNGEWVANVTIIEKEDDSKIDTEVEPNDKTNEHKGDDPVISTSDSYSPSASSLVIIACVIGCIVIGMLVMVMLYKRWYSSDATDRDNRNDTSGHVLPVHSSYGNNEVDDTSDDEKSKNNDKVQQAETFVTYESSDSTSTVVQPV